MRLTQHIHINRLITLTLLSIQVRATLIIVPPALLNQWALEIDKCIKGDKKLSVYQVDPKCVMSKLDFKAMLQKMPAAIRKSDIVLTTYNSLQDYSISNVLSEFEWARIALDEMQEIRNSTSKIAKSCEALRSGKRWMISGTPLFEGIIDLKGELNFLRVEPFCSR